MATPNMKFLLIVFTLLLTGKSCVELPLNVENNYHQNPSKELENKVGIKCQPSSDAYDIKFSGYNEQKILDGMLKAPGNNRQNYQIICIDTTRFNDQSHLQIDIELGNGESNASFDIFPEGAEIPTVGRPTGSILGAYDISRGTKNLRMIVEFTKGQVFQFGATGNWFSREGSTNNFKVTMSVLPGKN
jgi:hypothetical protein